MLTRLRDSFGDPLFIRTQRGVIPTPRAEALAEPIRLVLAQIQSVLVPQEFDPLTAEMTVAIAATDYAQKAVILPFLAALRKEAPNIRLSVRPVDMKSLSNQMEIGTLDMALLTPEMTGDSMRTRKLFDESYICVMRKGHPSASEPMTLDHFCALDHAIMSHDGTVQRRDRRGFGRIGPSPSGCRRFAKLHGADRNDPEYRSGYTLAEPADDRRQRTPRHRTAACCTGFHEGSCLARTPAARFRTKMVAQQDRCIERAVTPRGKRGSRRR